MLIKQENRFTQALAATVQGWAFPLWKASPISFAFAQRLVSAQLLQLKKESAVKQNDPKRKKNK